MLGFGRMRRALGLVVIAIVLGSSIAHAEGPANPRRRLGTKIAYAGLASSLTGIAVGAFAIGLGMDRPDAARPFYAVGYGTLGLGAIGLAAGFYLRRTSPEAPPDPIALDPVRSRHRTERRVGVALGGLGAAVLITGLAHAVGAYRDDSLADAQCPNGICNPDGARLLSRSKTLALAAEMLIGTGAVGLAGGVILYRGGRDTGPRLVPVAGPHLVGTAVVGRF